MFAFECSKKKIVQRIVQSFIRICVWFLWLIFAISSKEHLFLWISFYLECVCCLALCFVRTPKKTLIRLHALIAMQTPIIIPTQSKFCKHAKMNRTPHTHSNTHITLFPLISIHYSGFNCGDESKKTS